jgi:hypothetical protein
MTTTAQLSPHTHLPDTEWGPAKHDPEHPLNRRGSFGTALRDDDDLRPDDN